MKAIQAFTGTLDDSVHFVIVQDDKMEVMAFRVDANSGEHSLKGEFLGVRGDIYDIEVQGKILEQLSLRSLY